MSSTEKKPFFNCISFYDFLAECNLRNLKIIQNVCRTKHYNRGCLCTITTNISETTGVLSRMTLHLHLTLPKSSQKIRGDTRTFVHQETRLGVYNIRITKDFRTPSNFTAFVDPQNVKYIEVFHADFSNLSIY